MTKRRRKISAARRARAERVHLRDCPIRHGCPVWGPSIWLLSCAQCEAADADRRNLATGVRFLERAQLRALRAALGV